jgi:hypothetical protein
LLATIGAALAKKKDPDAETLFNEAISGLSSLNDDEIAWTTATVAAALADAGQRKRAYELVYAIPTPEGRSYALYGMVHLPHFTRQSSEEAVPVVSAAEQRAIAAFTPEGFMGQSKPVCFVWETPRRLWVACDDNRLRRLDDVDGNGQADKAVVFVEGLNSPTKLEVTKAGISVHQPTGVVVYRDANGDDRADRF